MGKCTDWRFGMIRGDMVSGDLVCGQNNWQPGPLSIVDAGVKIASAAEAKGKRHRFHHHHVQIAWVGHQERTLEECAWH